jgi:glycosyltransferase involved in cell wall biosynthesis
MPRNLFAGLPLIRKFKATKKLQQKYSFIATSSQYMKEQLLTNGYEDEKIEILPYFTYLPNIQKVDRSKEPVVLCLGRAVREKGIQYLLQAFRKIGENARLIIIGDGPMINELKTFAESLDIQNKVTFTGWLQHPDLEAYYRQASVVVLPSVWPEPFGIVGIEAMAHGKPVVASAIGGISDWLIDGKTGFLVEPSDWRRLADKIELLLIKPSLAKRFGLEGRKMVEKQFLEDAHMTKLLNLFEKAMEQKLSKS